MSDRGEIALSNRELALLHAGGESEVPFSRDEYRARLERVRAEMERRGIDTLVISDPASLCYLSGYKCTWYQDGRPKHWSPGSCIAVHSDADDFVYFEEEDELILNRTTTVARDVRIFPGAYGEPLPDALTRGPVTGSYDQPVFVAKTLEKMGWLEGSVGLELWSYRPSRGYSDRQQKELESAGAREIADGSDVVNAVRRIKSPQELAYIRTAARIADVGIAAAADALRPGISEIELLGEAYYAMAKAGGENSGIPSMIGSGPKSHCLHAQASRRRIMAGDIVNIDLCGVYHRYHSNAARCFSVGEPRQELREFVDKTNRVFQAVSEALRPGLPVSDLLAAGERVAREEGIWQERWWFGGYELGIAFPPDWVGNYAYDDATDVGDDALEPGFVSNFEFNFYMPGGSGIRELIDTYVVTDAEARFIQQAPVDLIVTV